MRRLIIVSDLHLGAGRASKAGINYREDFVYDSDFYEFLKYWSKDAGNYELELVLNGDIIDIIKSVYRDGKVYKKDTIEFLNNCVDAHKVFFSALKEFEYEGGKITYIIGNHDHAMASPELQAFLYEKTGISMRFVKREYFTDGIWIEHGHKYEAINRVDTETVWIKDEKGNEILNMPWGSRFVVEVIDKISFKKPYLDRWRPLGKSVKWGLIFETRITLYAIFRTILFILRNRRFYDPIMRRKFKVPLRSVMDAMGHKIVNRSADVILRRPEIKTAIMGHTHKGMVVRRGNKTYINTGTWIPYVSLDTPQIGLVEKKTFCIVETGKDKQPFSGLFVWYGIKKVFDEVKEYMEIPPD
ncbi:MAG: metallophosphoesterase [Candidatus Calescibacterium sp.]|nr:metallophosphoesterase [Candidatus Calescibacterium sp.]MCX7733715.1 metallophosphoesterase [bacterium]MDW8087501.1 metallophosphoesterase [Candidatus Calescibacterium sp.]